MGLLSSKFDRLRFESNRRDAIDSAKSNRVKISEIQRPECAYLTEPIRRLTHSDSCLRLLGTATGDHAPGSGFFAQLLCGRDTLIEAANPGRVRRMRREKFERLTTPTLTHIFP